MTPIDEKKETKKKDEEKQSKTNDWGSFGLSILVSFVYTLVWGVIGSNLLFIVNSDLDKLLPTDSTQLPYSVPSKQPKAIEMTSLGQRGGTYKNCKYASATKGKKGSFLDLFTGFTTMKAPSGKMSPNFPYNLKKKSLIDLSLMDNVKDWFANSIQFSYIHGRSILKDILGLFNKACSQTASDNFLFVSSILIVPLILFSSSSWGFFATLFGEFFSTNNAWIFGIASMILFGIGMFIPTTISVVQFMQTLGLFFLLPLLTNSGIVVSILKEKINLLAILFGGFVVSQAFTYLDNTISMSMLVAYAVLTLGSFFM
jgi:hypothetical protein